MPSVSISVDGAPVATVGTDGRTAVSVRAGGTRVDEDYADLSVSGGIYGRDDATEHRIWVSCRPLSVGQAVEVGFMEIGGDSGPGQTIEELFPDQPTLTRSTVQENAEMFAEVRSARVLRDGYSSNIPRVREASPRFVLILKSTGLGSAFFGPIITRNACPYLCIVTLSTA